MATTLEQLIDRVQRQVDDTQVPDDWVKDWLNEALMDLAPVLRLEARSTAGIVAGHAEYAQPSDLHTLRMLRLLNEVQPREAVPLKDFSSKGYKQWDNALILQPVPTADDTLELWYYRVPKALDANNPEPEVPTQFHHALVWYACASYQAQQKEISVEQSSYYPRYMAAKGAIERFTIQRVRSQSTHQWRTER
jgi:hypothetical protein